MSFIIENGVLKKYIQENDETEVIIPDGVTEIGELAFSDCMNLTGVIISDSVTKIGQLTFYNCKNLTNINIPNGVTEIESCAFLSCTSLENIIISDNVTKIGYNSFESTLWFKNLCKNNNGFGIINNILLSYRGSETDIIIPDGVTEICGAFYGNKNITSVTISDSVKEIGYRAFYNCTNLTSITIHDSVTEIGGASFANCTSLASITIPDSVKEIGWSAFLGCTSLKSITIPNSVTKIGLFAFEGCTNLKSVTILNSITEIYKDAFERCINFEKVITPDFEIKVHSNNKIGQQVCLVALKDFSLKMPHEIKYKIIWQMFMQKPDDEDVFAYVKKNLIKMLKYAIDENNVEIITAVCKRKNLLTKRNIDKIIEYAIQHTQNGGTVEIQAILMRYKNNNIGYSEPNFSI